MDKNEINPYDTGVATPFPDKAKELVVSYVFNRANPGDYVYNENTITTKDVYVVWFAKTLQNWKALVSSTVPDGKYYEVTFNGDKNEYYVDVYEKRDNVKVTETEPAPTIRHTQKDYEAERCR